MIPQRSAEQPKAVAIRRLSALAPLDERALVALRSAADRPRRYRAKREMLVEGQEIKEPLLVLNGWAAHQRILEDGRRQIIDFLLPGDLIGSCDYERPVASSSVVALTDVEACVAPAPAISTALARGYALDQALKQAHLASQVTRIGRMNALDRIGDLFLELLERLEIAGLAANGRFTLPLTQEYIADAVGLTAVHVNRTLKSLRQEGAIDVRGRDLILPDPGALRRGTGRAIPRVTLSD